MTNGRGKKHDDRGENPMKRDIAGEKECEIIHRSAERREFPAKLIQESRRRAENVGCLNTHKSEREMQSVEGGLLA